jgi:hypothetical protein
MASMGERRNAYTVWVEEPDENGPLGRPRYLRENKVKNVSYINSVEERGLD